MFKKLTVQKIFHIEADNFTHRIYIKVTAKNKVYIVKLNALNQRCNQNEFISNYIGLKIQAPVLEGVFLKFSQNKIDALVLYLNNNYPKLQTPDMSSIKNNTLFGIHWQDSTSNIISNNDLTSLLKEVSNQKEFYSLYAYDQYLKNYDRHIQNHIIVKDENNKPKYYNLIDGDRIFASTNWQKIQDIKDDFKCLKISNPKANWHKFLYEFVTEQTYYHVTYYSIKVEDLNTNDIDILILIMKNIYNISKIELGIIEVILTARKKDFFKTCINNVTCFPKIKQLRGL